MVPVWVTLPDDVPARESFQLVFDWTVQEIHDFDQANITIEARPDHRWEIDIDREITFCHTRTRTNLTINLTNIGNTMIF